MVRIGKSILWLTLVGLLWGNPSVSRAESNETSLAQAKQLFLAGKTLFQERQFKEALVKFLESFALVRQLYRAASVPEQKKKYETYLRAYWATLATTYHWSKIYLRAQHYYLRCISDAPKPETQAYCRKYLREVRKNLAFLEIRTEPEQANLAIKRAGDPIQAKTAWKSWLAPGAFRIRISLPGYLSVQKKLVLRPGVRAAFHYKMLKPSCPAPQPPPPVDQMELTPSVPLAATSTMPASLPPQQPFSSGMPPWQIALIAAGAAVGVAAIGITIGVVAFGASNTHYVIK